MSSVDLARDARPVARAAMTTLSHGLPRESWVLVLWFAERVLGMLLALQLGMAMVALFFGEYVGPITVALYLGLRVVALFPGRWRAARAPKAEEPREPMGYRDAAARVGSAEQRPPEPAEIGRALVVAAPVLLLYLACWAGIDSGWVEGLLASTPSSAIVLVWAGWALVVLALRRLRKRLEQGRG